MKHTMLLTAIFLFVQFLYSACSQYPESEKEIFMFSYFTGNGESGLHLAYSEDGYHFTAINNGQSLLTPTAGGDKLMRDPCIIRGGDGLFHMVWTVSWNEKGIGYATSPDLIHWSDQRYLPVMEHEKDTRNTWAPEVFYDEDEQIYLIFWSSTIEGLYPETQSNLENAYNHRKYYTTTKDFRTFSETRLFYEPGFNVIDGTIIKSDDEYVMFIKDETIEPAEKNIRITRSHNLTGEFGPASEPITGDYWAEGPSVTKVSDQWIVYFDKYVEGTMGAVASPDLESWTDISDKISFPEGTRHGTVFTITENEFEYLMSALIPE
ncbi:MAG: glycosyl hydrolase [Balneolaceae bacterium]|nr:MAG: glycosyl hydrolase [Balneolaceae bacterium]